MRYFIIGIYSVIISLYFIEFSYSTIPIKSGGGFEIILYNLDLAGSPTPGYSSGDYLLYYSFGEYGGITKLSGNNYLLSAGYYSQDLIPPSSINNFQGFPSNLSGSIRLQWSSPGDDLDDGILLSGTRFHISSTTLLTESENLSYWAQKRDNPDIIVTTANVNPGMICSFTITGLSSETTFYFRIWCLDQSANWSEVSNLAIVQNNIFPGSITNLLANKGKYGKSVDLFWTAPGNNNYDGDITKGMYAIQYTNTIDDVIWSTSNAQVIFSTSVLAGQIESKTI